MGVVAPALAGTREYKQSDRSRWQAEVVMEFGISRRIKPKRISMQEIWRNFDGPPKGKQGATECFGISRPKVAQIGPSWC